MRWVKPKDGDIRHKRWFALVPVEINDETRWLEWVTVKSRAYITSHVQWIPIEFVDKSPVVPDPFE